MEVCKIEISKELLSTLVDSDVITTDDFKVIKVEDNSFDYSKSDEWNQQKTLSDKAYKKLKEIEFNIRHK